MSSLNNKSSILSEIPVSIYRHFKHLISEPISYLFNNMISTGVFPDILKISRVTPVFKKGDSSAANNYRPISNLVVLNKIFEKLIYKRLIHFLDNHNILTNKQYGFRRGSQLFIIQYI